jgi:HEAT repeat protein
MAKTVADRIADLKSEDSQQVKEAIRALSYLGDGAVQPLIEALRADSVPFQPLAETFREIGNTAVEALAALLAEADAELQQRIVRVLGFSQNDRAVLPLLMTLQSRDENIRALIAEQLGHFTDLRAVPPLLGLLQKDTNPVRANAALSLGAFGRDMRVTNVLLEAIKDADPLVRGGAVQGLARILNDERVQAALNAATSDPDDDVRILAAAALQHQRGDLMAFQRVKMDVDATVDSEVQRILADGKVNEADVDAMRHSNPKVRARLMEIVSQFGKTTAFKLILPGLNDINPAVRTSAVEAVVKMGEKVVPDLMELVNHSSTFMRSGAADALGMIGDARGVDTLLTLLQDKEAQVRTSAIAALSKFPAEERIIRALQQATRDTSADIGKRAVQALEQYGVQPTSANPVARFFRRLLGGE